MSKKDDLAKAANEALHPLQGSSFFPDIKQSQSPTKTLTSEIHEHDKRNVSREQTTEETKKRTFHRINERTNVRNKIRHTFDIFQDQLHSLREISLSRELTFGKRVLIGDLVQEALDMFITKERNKR